MRIVKTSCFAMLIIAASAVVTAAQIIIQVQPDAQQQAGPANDERDYSALVGEIFAPITDELNLTNDQKLKIVAIITATVIKADPLMDQLDQLDDQISAASLRDSMDEAKILQLSAQEAQLMGQMIAMKARAKANIYQVLSPEQRALITRQFRTKPQAEGSLGSISN